MPGRQFNNSTYRYGFNGQEKVDEVYNVSGSYLDFEFRGYDSRLGRFMKVDPLTKKYPELTPYQFASNTPIWAKELEGLEANYSNGSAEEPFGGGNIPEGNKTDHSGPLSDSHAAELNVVSGDANASTFGKNASVEVRTGSFNKNDNLKNRIGNFMENGGRLGGHASIKTNEGTFGFSGGIRLQSTPGHYGYTSGFLQGEQYVSFPLKDISLDQYWGIVDTYIDKDKFDANGGKNPTEAGFVSFLKYPGYDYRPLFGYRCASSCLRVLNDNKIIQDTELKMKFVDAPTPQALIRYLQDKKKDYNITPSSELNPNKTFSNNFKH